jgi:copper oxidase (laccase) domain-containing protein
VSGGPGEPSPAWSAARTAVVAQYSPTWASPGILHAFAVRQPGVAVDVERTEAVERLASAHAELRSELGVGQYSFCTAEQVHGAEVAVVEGLDTGTRPGVDSLVTASEGVCLGIYTADCCAVFLADPQRRVIGLAHAGAKGTRLGVVAETVRCMQERFGCPAPEIKALLSPCIRPPLYEWDFAAEIRRQLAEVGVGHVTDPGICTGADTQSYYSYRVEKGKTGRMLALLALGRNASQPTSLP